MPIAIQRLTVMLTAAMIAVAAGAAPSFQLGDPGTEEIVDYEKYGEFLKSGTKDYRYVIRDRDGLARASGEGIDPNLTVTNNPEFKKALAAGQLKGDWWKHVNTGHPQIDYYVWCIAPEDPGVRLLFVGKALEKGGHLMHALKAYRAALVLYPDSACWSSGAEFQWDVATAAWNAMVNLLRKNPQLQLRLVGADVTSRAEASGLVITVNPGKLVKITPPPAEPPPADAPAVAEPPAEASADTHAAVEAAAPGPDTNGTAAVVEAAPAEGEAEPAAAEADEAEAESAVYPPVDPNAVMQRRGTGTVQLVQYASGDWQVFVEGQRYFIRGMNYAPVRVGVKPWEWNWLWSDEDTNGIVDSFEVWVDANQNGQQDADEPTTSDYRLLRDMGCNTIKLYITDPELCSFNTLAMRRMYRETGIRVIVGNFLGAYCNGSGADWEAGTDYTNKKQRENMRASVSNLVIKLRGEPWVLAWVLGNENNMEMSGDVNATRTNGSKYPDVFGRFLNEVAKMIHEMDPNHPVGIGNLLTGLVEYYGKWAPEIDYLGINSYVGDEGFGATWDKVRKAMNRPVVITEFGCDAYYTGKGPDEEMQSRYLLQNWEDIVFNSAGRGGAGNAIGGFVFEWLDEWWKDTLNYFEDPVDHQTTRPVFPMPFPDGQAQEEWFGIMSQGAGNASPFLRVPRKAYYDLQKIWVEEPGEGKEAAGREM